MSKDSILTQAIRDMAQRLDDIKNEIELAVTKRVYGDQYKPHERIKIHALLDPERGGTMGQVLSPRGVEAWFVLYADTEKGEAGYELYHLSEPKKRTDANPKT